MGILSVGIGIYLLLGLMLYLFQGSMVFLSNMPGRQLDATPLDIGLDFEEVHIETTDGETIHGWFVPATEARGTLLFFHGNAGNISHRLESIMIFNRLGLNVLIIDYRGYGQSTGKTTEAGIYLDAEAAWNYLVGERGVPAGRIILFGRSLGGAAAAWLAGGREPAALIVESSFSSGADMARRLYPIFPAKLLTRLKFPVAEFVSRAQSPVLVVHSRDDEIIPIAMGQAIHGAAGENGQFLELRGDHNAGFWISRNAYVPGLDQFLVSVLGQQAE